jgi:hypothetical protein
MRKTRNLTTACSEVVGVSSAGVRTTTFVASMPPQPSVKLPAADETPNPRGSAVQQVYRLLVAALDPPWRRQRLQDALVGSAVLHLVGTLRIQSQGTS